MRRSLRLRRLLLALAALLAVGGARPAFAQIPEPPYLGPPAGFAAAETERFRFFAQEGAPIDAEAFAIAYGDGAERVYAELTGFLPAPAGMIEIYLYADEAAFLAATGNPRRPELLAGDVLADPGVGDVAVALPSFLNRSPLEAENALRHAIAHVVLRRAAGGKLPRGFDEGFAQYAEIPVTARLARAAALVQGAAQRDDLLTWSDLNRPQPPAADPAAVAAHAYAMVAFLIDRHGLKLFGEYVTALRDEPDWRAAMRAVYKRPPMELEAGWEEELPRWVAGGWRDNLVAAFDLQPARDLLAKAHYAAAKRELERSLRLYADLGDVAKQAEVEALLRQGDVGLQAEALMGQIQQALERHTYDRAQTLLSQARAQYEQLPVNQRPNDLLGAYDALAAAGLQGAADLETARRLARGWRDYAEARRAAVAAAGAFARLGDEEMLARTQVVLDDLDVRQRRLVLLLGALALLSAAWLALWLWARGSAELDWGPLAGRVRPDGPDQRPRETPSPSA